MSSVVVVVMFIKLIEVKKSNLEVCDDMSANIELQKKKRRDTYKLRPYIMFPLTSNLINIEGTKKKQCNLRQREHPVSILDGI